MSRPDFDHTSFAVRDADAWGRRLRRELGATPLAGEVLPTFRYLLFHIGTADSGGRLELIEPQGAQGFLARFLDSHGEGPHHLTFTVPDIAVTLAQVRELGFTVVGEDLGHAPWREAFLMPDGVHRVVIQLAQSDRQLPTVESLLSTRFRDVASFPSNRGGTDPLWWQFVWEVEPEGSAALGATFLNTTDLARSRRLFEGVLGGTARESCEGVRFVWPRSSLVVRQASRPGVTHVRIHDTTTEEIAIGSGRLLGRVT